MSATLTNYEYIEPTIISMADSANYLVGALDSDDNFIALHESEDIVVVGSLGAAKQYLRNNSIL